MAKATVDHAATALLEIMVAHQRARLLSQAQLDGVLEAHTVQEEVVEITAAATETTVSVVHAWVLVLN